MNITDQLKERRETVWLNPKKEVIDPPFGQDGYSYVHTKIAQNRFLRFMPYFASAFPETAPRKGIIESSLTEIPAMRARMNEDGAGIRGRVFLKDDAHLPIAGSVKARGGISEVLRIAEGLAQKAGMLKPTDNYAKIDSDEFRQFYAGYMIQVGSTGNLGLSIGRTAARLGFRVVVHMSSDAKDWKKKLLRSEGVEVREYDGDYTQAVAAGRAASAQDDHTSFIDDENSRDLFFGYSTAAPRFRVQLAKADIDVDEEHPLFVYLPCGVGGAPGGITFGLKQFYGDHVHCFFAEPVEAPCFMLGMSTGLHEKICVRDIGLTGKTEADGLAVGRVSAFVCQMMEPLVSGSCTVADDRLKRWQKQLNETEGIFAEVSACAGFAALDAMERPGSAYADYLQAHHLTDKMERATHIVWSTGGGLMPEAERFRE